MNRPLQLIAVQLRVPDLRRSLEYYADRLGFVTASEREGQADLAVSSRSKPLLTLIEQRDAHEPSHDSAGLFHAALLLPDRPALGAWLALAAARSVEFEGFSDHGVSEAIYLSDPDGNGLEFYVDRPRDQWPFDQDGLVMTTKPLNIRSLLDSASPPASEPLVGARWGHLHLRVTQLERSELFYRSTLGMEVTQRSYAGARFLAADGYHHHVGLNVWGSPHSPQPPGGLGLAEATFVRDGTTTEALLTDPDGIHIRLQPA
jgi:catechol 2,3-dioxygenase